MHEVVVDPEEAAAATLRHEVLQESCDVRAVDPHRDGALMHRVGGAAFEQLHAVTVEQLALCVADHAAAFFARDAAQVSFRRGRRSRVGLAVALPHFLRPCSQDRTRRCGRR